MKTHELMELLAADRTVARAPGRTLGVSMLPAMALALLLLLLFIGLRDDIVVAFGSLRFAFKLLLNMALAAASAGLLLRLAHPGAAAGLWRFAVWVLPLLLASGVVIELAAVPRAQWWAMALGRNSTWCLRVIPLLAVAPLLASLWALRQAAPARPSVAGALAGLMSSGIAGAMYALHCPDDSPLFVAIWYVIAAALVTALGALLGSRWLRW